MRTKNGKSSPNKNKGTSKHTDPQVSIATIGAITGVIVAALGLIGSIAPLVFNYISSRPIATPISSPTNSTVAIATTVSVIPPTIETRIVEPTGFATETLNSISPTSTSINNLPNGMDVQLIADRSSGKPPVFVKFDARSSFFRDSNGIIYKCQSNKCNYTWYIYLNGNLVNAPGHTTEGTLTFKFTKKGAYHIIVNVCRDSGDSDCASDGTGFDAS